MPTAAHANPGRLVTDFPVTPDRATGHPAPRNPQSLEYRHWFMLNRRQGRGQDAFYLHLQSPVVVMELDHPAGIPQ